MESAGSPIEFSASSFPSSFGDVWKSMTGNSIEKDSSRVLVKLAASEIAELVSFFIGETTVGATT